MRGKKICPKCNQSTGPRAYTCKKCGYEFTVKTKVKRRRKRKMWEKCKWIELKKGDIIKVKTGSGPVWEKPESDIVYMGVHGTFRVDSIIKDGIMAYPHNNKSFGSSGLWYIYMGPVKQSPHSDCIERRPHSIKRYIKLVKNNN